LKGKKAIGIITAVGASLLLMFSVFVFPFILAASPDNRELETIEMKTVFPADEVSQSEDSDIVEQPLERVEQQGEADQSDDEVVIDINAISKEMAIEIVTNEIETRQFIDADPNGVRSSTFELRSARYIEAVDYIDAPIWQVLFYSRTEGDNLLGITEGYTPEEFLLMAFNSTVECCESYTIDAFDNGMPALRRVYSHENLFVVEVNAFTGELIRMGDVYLCDHSTRFDTFSYDDLADWNMVNELARYYFLTPEPGTPVPTPEPRPISTP